jgi:hypothetical protein
MAVAPSRLKASAAEMGRFTASTNEKHQNNRNLKRSRNDSQDLQARQDKAQNNEATKRPIPSISKHKRCYGLFFASVY